jgi:hypothetical protein
MRQIWWMFIGGLLVACSTSWGSIPGFRESIELGVANADCVIVGHIVHAEKTLAPVGAPIGPWWKVTVRVEEALVDATPGADVVFWTEDDGGPGYAVSPTANLYLLIKGSRTLFAKTDTSYAKIPLTLYEGPRGQEVMELNAAALRNIPNMTLHLFENREQLIAAIMPYCKRPLSVKSEPISLKFWDWEVSILLVPLDARSEAIAQRWMKSADPEMRWNGVRILRWMKSAANVALLQETAALSPTSDANESTREMAMLTLEKWGIPIARTTRFEPASWSEMLGIQLWVSVLILLVVPAVYWKWSGQHTAQHRQRVRRAFTLAWVVLVTAIAILWARSYFELDGGCKGTWQAGAINGEALAVRCLRWEGNVDWPWEYCRPSNLRQICSVGGLGWRIDLSHPQYYFFDAWGTNSVLEDTRSGPALVLVYRMPFWFAEALLCFLAVSIKGVRWARKWLQFRRSRGRGFPVEMASSSNKYK